LVGDGSFLPFGKNGICIAININGVALLMREVIEHIVIQWKSALCPPQYSVHLSNIAAPMWDDATGR